MSPPNNSPWAGVRKRRRGVNLYRVYQGMWSPLGRDTYQVGGLSPWTLYGFSVRAEDGAGNLAMQGLASLFKPWMKWLRPGRVEAR